MAVAVAGAAEQPAQRIPGQGRPVRPADQPVLHVIDEGVGHPTVGRGRQIAVGVIGEAGRAGRLILVQPVGGVGAGQVVAMTAELIGRIVVRTVHHLADRIVGEGGGEILRRADYIVRQRRQPRRPVIAIGGRRGPGGAVAAIQRDGPALTVVARVEHQRGVHIGRVDAPQHVAAVAGAGRDASPAWVRGVTGVGAWTIMLPGPYQAYIDS